MSVTTSRYWSPLRIVCVLLAALLAGALVFAGWQYWLFSGGVFKTSSFNEQKWKSLNQKTSDSSCYRGGMANDIKTKVLRIGQSRSEVEKILGKPDTDKGSIHEYLLGMCSRFRIDFDTLDVHFSSDGKLTNVYIVQH